MTSEEYYKVHDCCRNIILKWYASHGVYDKPTDWEDKASDATWYVFYLLNRKGQSLQDLKCKLVTYCYMPCIHILLDKNTVHREKTERVMDIFEYAAHYDTFEDDMIEQLSEEGY